MHNVAHIFSYLDGHVHGPFFFLTKTVWLYGEVSLLAGGVFLIKWREIPVRTFGLLVSWVLIPLLFFSLIKTKMQAYTYFTAPAFFILSGWLFTYARHKVSRNIWIVGVGLLLLSPVIRFVETMQKVDVSTLLSASPQRDTFASCGSRPVVIFGSPTPVNDMFFAEETSYETVPSQQVLDSLGQEYCVIVREK